MLRSSDRPGSRPSIFSPTLRAKYDAHLLQARTHTSPESARARYITLANEIGWDGIIPEEDEEDPGDIDLDAPDEDAGKRKEGMGFKVSMMSDPDGGHVE
jgi:hypothetical protein